MKYKQRVNKEPIDEVDIRIVDVIDSLKHRNPATMSVDTYIMSNSDRLDTRRFKAIQQGPICVRDYVTRYKETKLYRIAARQDRWAHASRHVLEYVIRGSSDLLYARIYEDWRWTQRFSEMMTDILKGNVVFQTVQEVRGPVMPVVENFDDIYYYRDSDGWVADLSL